METLIREPAVSGRFYPSEREDLETLINKTDRETPTQEEIPENKTLLGAVVPHAGYIYSAQHAVPFFRLLAARKPAPDTIIIACPNHYGYGPSVALDMHHEWETPLGDVRVDHDFYPLLGIEVASESHRVEHSAEVMLPLLQYFMKTPFSVLPVCMRDQTPHYAAELARKIHVASRKLNKEIAFIASSDFSHYVSPQRGKEADDRVLDKILSLDVQGVFSEVCSNDISICGYGPIMTLIELASLSLQKPEAKVISRGHSGQVSPSDQVVHYITAIMYGDQRE